MKLDGKKSDIVCYRTSPGPAALTPPSPTINVPPTSTILPTILCVSVCGALIRGAAFGLPAEVLFQPRLSFKMTLADGSPSLEFGKMSVPVPCNYGKGNALF